MTTGWVCQSSHKGAYCKNLPWPTPKRASSKTKSIMISGTKSDLVCICVKLTLLRIFLNFDCSYKNNIKTPQKIVIRNMNCVNLGSLQFQNCDHASMWAASVYDPLTTLNNHCSGNRFKGQHYIEGSKNSRNQSLERWKIWETIWNKRLLLLLMQLTLQKSKFKREGKKNSI